MSTVPAIPDHSLLRPIGRGAYGEVWLARSVMGTLRAVKVIWRRQFDTARPFERELAGIQRYEPVSRSSGGLVHVLQIGINDREEYFYYVMELADDAAGSGVLEAYEPRTLRSDLKRLGRLPTADCLRLAIDVASGLGELHRHGLVHRDVKPGNIIFVNKRAKLADIGLITAHGEGRTFVGTEGYIPPEGPGTPAADLYALGIVLYEASTGFSPERFPDAPSEWVTDSAGDESIELHEVILKACEGQRQRRYADVETLQADLAILQSGQSVRRVRALERRYARLRQTGLAGTSLLVIALLAAFFASYRARVAAQNNAKESALREQAQHAQAKAESAERQARQQLYTALLEQARATVRSGEVGQRVHALDAIRQAAAISTTADLRGMAIAATTLSDWRLERTLTKAADTTLVQFDPAFERLALCRGGGPVEIQAVKDQRLLASLPASANLTAYVARWSPDGQFLAVKRDWNDSNSLADLEVWNVAQQRQLFVLKAVEYDALVFHPHLPQILVALKDTGLSVRNLANGQELRSVQLPGVPFVLAISPDGERLAASYELDGAAMVSIYRFADGAELASHRYEDTVRGIDWHPDGKWLATADYSGAVQLLDTETGQARLLGRHKFQAVLAAFCPTGDALLSAGWEREFVWWDLRRMQRAFTIGLNSYFAQIRSDGNQCAVVTDTEIQLHAIERPTVCREVSQALGFRLNSAAFSPDGRWLAATGSQGLGVWDATRTDINATVPQAAEARLSFSWQGDLWASTDQHGYRWHLVPGVNPGLPPKLEPIPLSEPRGFTSLCLASNQLFFTTERGSCALMLDGSGSSQYRPTERGLSVASPDGKWLAIYPPFSRVLNIYRTPDLQPVATLVNQASITSVEFSPRGDEVAVSTPRLVEIWSTSNWQRTRQLSFIGLLYFPNLRTFWLRKDYRTSGLYDAQTLELLLPFPSGTCPLAISRDGRFLAASVDSQRLQLWDLAAVNSCLKELGLAWNAR